MGVARQLTFEDMAPPLWATTFVVFDLETTGASAAVDAVTEVGAVKVRGGEVLGTFGTLVNPGVDIPADITYLTGITEAMVRPAPRIEAVLPAFLEWIGADAVLVGHNVRFDVSFVRAACDALGYQRPENRVVDTCTLARRMLRDEVPNCKLGTLADRLRLPHKPNHRALDDAWATVDLLHYLFERVGSLGVTHLDDLLELPKAAGHPQGDKLKWVATLPRLPGTYEFRDRSGRPLYVGKAVELRRRVRQYFSTDDRRKIPQLLREAASLHHEVCAHDLEAGVREIRRIQAVEPRFNRQGKRWRQYRWIRITDEAWPRLSVVKQPKVGDIGPLSSARTANSVVEAVLDAVPLRRCSGRVPKDVAVEPLREGACASAQLGVSVCPCAGGVDPAAYAAIADTVRRGLTSQPSLLLDPLAARMRTLARDRRFEEAAALRDRAAALSRTVTRQRRLDALHRSGHLVVEVAGEGGAVLDDGRLTLAWAGDDRPLAAFAETPIVALPPAGPPRAHEVDELLVVSQWLRSRSDRLTVLSGTVPEWDDLDVPRFEPLPRRRAG